MRWLSAVIELPQCRFRGLQHFKAVSSAVIISKNVGFEKLIGFTRISQTGLENKMSHSAPYNLGNFSEGLPPDALHNGRSGGWDSLPPAP